ncbi:Gram-positive pilin backbone subunit 2, Cna-B-like domain-containing protein [Bifidobacterium sp. DSM 109960]|uniref:Gram-positive pilin backbone subunit 2, Cna-B-like domain-containing protein n=1 Tax=Bifidobacterium erythrocebi TaxID=2675325 RepID=A0A7Y0EUV5_9BIFI|nr:SpaH/EbpB family LPXTG-anchored major pilin [Bifidobacterium sp. DSM 109960]NMM96865.1 Gram-positive pilin backbone subunit 2, Cna-B-like domain-containing protein [Bifidobacterium sp. DSM 109960]
MNKVFKSLVAVAATAAMAVAGFAGAASATAAENTVNVTVPTSENLKGHTYTAYQILTGSQATTGGALGSTTWGTGIDADAFLAALKADKTIGQYFTNVETSDQFVAALGNSANFPPNGSNTNIVAKLALANKTTDGTVLASGANALAKGYYLIVDSTADGQTVYNPAVLAITSDITISDKTDVPSLVKKVQENKKNIADKTYGDGFNDVADYNIGDEVPFHLIGSVPDMSQYETYKYTFSDTLGNGFDAPTSVKVYLSNDQKLDDSDSDITSSFTISNPLANSFTVSTNDLKTVPGVNASAHNQYVIVSYTAKLNASAEIGLPGNENEAFLSYSNKPDQSGTGDNNTNDTPHDKVIVFTYGLNGAKVDSTNTDKKLSGAEFKLQNAAGKWVTFDANKKVTGWADSQEAGSTLTSDENGNFGVTGLDDGEYTLVETKAPEGYNLPAKGFSIKLTAKTANGQDWNGIPKTALTDIAVTVDGDEGTGDITSGTGSIVIKNVPGSSLPSTGGMGTTILYAAGAAIVLVAAFGIAFAVRRRNAR